MSITREQVLALQALEQSIKVGDWSIHRTDVVDAKGYLVAIYPDNDAIDRDNFKFIAAARNALPALITTWLSMSDRIAAVEKVCSEAEQQFKDACVEHKHMRNNVLLGMYEGGNDLAVKVRAALAGEGK